MSLYHTYRPKTLRGVFGNTQIITSLKKMLSDTAKMPHSYLLSGPTGCGKTTLARIIKNSLGVSDNDFFELNSAEMRGIDTIREITKNSQYHPLESPYRIYLIDECHKLTNDAQNAFLKPLEDTPPHVIFILCTTEPEKLIKAVIGRCQKFQLDRLQENEMEKLLKRIIKKEGEEVDEKTLSQIIETGDGHPRNSIQILEQVLNTAPENRMEAAKLSAEEKSESYELCKALIANSGWKTIRPILNGLKGQQAEGIRRHVLAYAQAALLRGENDKAGLVMEEFIEPFYHTGFPQLVYACYSIVKNS